MKTEDAFARDLDRWTHQPTALPAADAARAVAARLHGRPQPPPWWALRPAFVAGLAAVALLAAAVVLLRDHGAPAAPAGTTATITLSSGTQVVIDLREVRR